MNSETGIKGFRDRIVSLIDKDKPFEWAKKVGIPSSTFDRMWNGGIVPKAGMLLKISRHCGKSVDWLLTGEGEVFGSVDSAPSASPPAPLNEDLMDLIGDAISAVYKEENARIGPGKLTRLAARIYGDLIEFPPEERPVALKGMMAAQRRALRQQPSDKIDDKRLA